MVRHVCQHARRVERRRSDRVQSCHTRRRAIGDVGRPHAYRRLRGLELANCAVREDSRYGHHVRESKAGLYCCVHGHARNQVCHGPVHGNNWLWTADHDLDDARNNNTQLTIYAGRGLYVESEQGRLWL